MSCHYTILNFIFLNNNFDYALIFIIFGETNDKDLYHFNLYPFFQRERVGPMIEKLIISPQCLPEFPLVHVIKIDIEKSYIYIYILLHVGQNYYFYNVILILDDIGIIRRDSPKLLIKFIHLSPLIVSYL